MDKPSTDFLESADFPASSKEASAANTLIDNDGGSEAFPREAWGVTAATYAWGVSFACTQVSRFATAGSRSEAPLLRSADVACVTSQITTLFWT